MKYETIANDNKFLYGELESLTCQISYIKARGLDSDVEALERRKDNVREIIGINLDNMEQIWEAQALSFRMANKSVRPLEVPTDKELRVINKYIENPNKTIETLAFELCMNRANVSSIITKYLSQKFNLNELIHPNC